MFGRLSARGKIILKQVYSIQLHWNIFVLTQFNSTSLSIYIFFKCTQGNKILARHDVPFIIEAMATCFVDNIFKWIFMNEMFSLLIQLSIKCLPWGLIDKKIVTKYSIITSDGFALNRHQTITCSNVGQVLRCHMVSPGTNEWTINARFACNMVLIIRDMFHPDTLQKWKIYFHMIFHHFYGMLL